MVERTAIDKYNDRQKGAILSKVLQSWNRIERQRPKSSIKYVDFDLTPPELPDLPEKIKFDLAENPLRRRDQVMQYLYRLRDSFNPRTLDGEFLNAKVESALVRVEAEEGLRPIIFSSYISRSLALPTALDMISLLIPEEVLDTKKEELSDLSKALGYQFNRRGQQRYQANLSLRNPDTIRTKFYEAEEKLGPIMQRAIGISTKPNYNLRFDDKDEVWVARATGNFLGFQQIFNLNSRVAWRMLEGSPERLFAHEILAHMYQADQWRKRVLTGEINPGYAVTTIPGPEQWTCEALGNTLALFIPEIYENFSEYAKYSFQYRLYESWVKRNAIIYANTAPGHKGETKDFLMEYLPTETSESSDRLIDEEFIRNHRNRAYQITYGASYEFSRYANQLIPYRHHGVTPEKVARRSSDKRVDFVKETFKQPLTPLQAENTVKRLTSEPSLLDRFKGAADNMIRRASMIVI